MSIRHLPKIALLFTPALLLFLTSAGAESWRDDSPGQLHRIDIDGLPAPFATPSGRNFPQVVQRPANPGLQLPRGFQVSLFTEIQGPRVMRVAPNGDIFVAQRSGGQITVLRPTRDGSGVASSSVFADGLTGPFGMQFYPAGDNPQWLYVAEMNRVVRFAYSAGDNMAKGDPEVVVAQLSPVGGGHNTRDLVFSQDGRRMFVSVGSETNVAENNMPAKSAAEIRAWEAEHGVGATWGNEENRADVLVYDVASPGAGRVYATGIRNCVGLTIQPDSGDVWCTVNERDGLGDDIVPDYSTRVQEGGFYGWPWYYMGDNEDPRHEGARPDLAGKTISPDVPYQAHSAAVGLAFYTVTDGRSAFPAEYVGDGFAALHGSWNKAERTGHKIVRVLMENGEPTGAYEDFLTGFITPDGEPWGRPASVTVLGDGSMLVSDDGSNAIFRVTYTR